MNIPTADTVRQELKLRRDIADTAQGNEDPSTVEAQFRLLLDRVQQEIEQLLRGGRTARGTITIPINPRHRSTEVFDQVRLYLEGLGYQVTLNQSDVEVSWVQQP